MGAFTQDYEYVEGLGDLDQCNGRFGVTPEFPNGIYYYVVSDDFPLNYTWQSLKDINQKRLHYNSITVLLF